MSENSDVPQAEAKPSAAVSVRRAGTRWSPPAPTGPSPVRADPQDRAARTQPERDVDQPATEAPDEQGDGAWQSQAFALLVEPLKKLPLALRGALVLTAAALLLWVKVLGGPLPGAAAEEPKEPAPSAKSVICIYVAPGASCAPP